MNHEQWIASEAATERRARFEDRRARFLPSPEALPNNFVTVGVVDWIEKMSGTEYIVCLTDDRNYSISAGPLKAPVPGDTIRLMGRREGERVWVREWQIIS